MPDKVNPPLKHRYRTLALTAGVTIITITGALVGATLKSRKQNDVPNQRTLKPLEPDPDVGVDQQIALLESTRSQLIGQRQQLESKIEQVRANAQKRETAERERRETRERMLGMGSAEGGAD